MKEIKEKIVAPASVRAFFSKCGLKGGSSTSEKKKISSPKNGSAPCKPGKFRGRPPKDGLRNQIVPE